MKLPVHTDDERHSNFPPRCLTGKCYHGKSDLRQVFWVQMESASSPPRAEVWGRGTERGRSPSDGPLPCGREIAELAAAYRENGMAGPDRQWRTYLGFASFTERSIVPYDFDLRGLSIPIHAGIDELFRHNPSPLLDATLKSPELPVRESSGVFALETIEHYLG